LFDQGCGHALCVFVRDFGQHNKTGMALNQGGDVAVVRSGDQIAIPPLGHTMYALPAMMPRNGTIFDLRRAFTNGNGIFDFPQLKALLSGMPGASDRTWTARAFLQFLLQNPAGLNIEAAIYRSPLGTLLGNTLPVNACDTRFCSSSGYLCLSQPAICCGDHFRRSFRAINWHKG
jgi:hypothetical protein